MTTRSVVAALHTLGRGAELPVEMHITGSPFITITRQAWAGGIRLADQLVERFTIAGCEPAWQGYDREIIEQVATNHDLPTYVVEQLLERPQTWLEDIVSGLSYDPARPSDEVIYAKVVATIRALAQRGHAVFVGRGSAYCTQDMPTGVHIRLFAPLEDRIAFAAQDQDLPHDEAERLVYKTDQRRQTFLKRFWPNSYDRDDLFSLSINTSEVSTEQQVSMIAMLAAARQTASA